MLFTLIVLICLIGILYWWYGSNRRREAAFKAAVNYCDKMHVQLLDQSVHCHKLSITWRYGKPKIKTIYRFDYTVHKTDRQHCHLILVGYEVEWIGAIKNDDYHSEAQNTGDRVVHFSAYSHLKPKNDVNNTETDKPDKPTLH